MIVESINIKEKNIKDIISKYELDEDLLLDVEDSSEIARFLEKKKYTEVILKYPIKNDIATLGIYLEQNKILFLYNEDFPFTINNSLKTTTLILVDIIYQITENYFKILKTTDKKIRKIKLASKTSVKNNDLLTLFELQNDIDDYVISIKGNLGVLNKIITITQTNNEFINDTKIENEQALETAVSYSKIVSNLRSTLEIITNNITNKRMEGLTIVNVSALIITSISGLYGMNVRLPLANIYNIFYYIILLSIIFALSFGFFLKKKFSEKK